MRKIMDWLGALICISIALRALFYLVSRAYYGTGFEPFDWVAIPIGLVATYIGYMYIRRILERRNAHAQSPAA